MFAHEALKKMILAEGLKQKFIAEQTGIPERTLSRILNGKVKCGIEQYVRICNFFSVPLGSFLIEENKMLDAPERRVS